MIQQKNKFNFWKRLFFTGLIVSCPSLFLFNCSTSSKHQETTMSSIPNRGLAGIVREEICQVPGFLFTISAGSSFGGFFCGNDGKLVKLCQEEDQYLCYINGKKTCCRYNIVSEMCQKDYVPCGKGSGRKCCLANKRKKCTAAGGIVTVRAGLTYGKLICNNDGQLVEFCPGDQFHCKVGGKDSCCRYNIVSEVCQKDYVPCGKGSGRKCCLADKRKKCTAAGGVVTVSAGLTYGKLICNNDGQLVEFCPGDQFHCNVDGRRYCCEHYIIGGGQFPDDDSQSGDGVSQ